MYSISELMFVFDSSRAALTAGHPDPHPLNPTTCVSLHNNKICI
jgi:hypothetical protein